jgi:hypothetical protein
VTEQAFNRCRLLERGRSRKISGVIDARQHRGALAANKRRNASASIVGADKNEHPAVQRAQIIGRNSRAFSVQSQSCSGLLNSVRRR